MCFSELCRKGLKSCECFSRGQEPNSTKYSVFLFIGIGGGGIFHVGWPCSENINVYNELCSMYYSFKWFDWDTDLLVRLGVTIGLTSVMRLQMFELPPFPSPHLHHHPPPPHLRNMNSDLDCCVVLQTAWVYCQRSQKEGCKHDKYSTS